jgi:hypothetical protein
VVSRGEFELLKTIVAAAGRRLDQIDSAGTRGVAVVQAQLVDVVKDLAELKADVDRRFDAHSRMHAQEAGERLAGRRWAVGTAIAALVLLVAILALTAQVALHR